MHSILMDPTNGEIFDASQMVATSKTLPLPTIAKVTNLDNGESVVVRVNNRGPFVNTRIMDLSPAAAEKIGLNSQAKVQVQVLTEQSINEGKTKEIAEKIEKMSKKCKKSRLFQHPFQH